MKKTPGIPIVNSPGGSFFRDFSVMVFPLCKTPEQTVKTVICLYKHCPVAGLSIICQIIHLQKPNNQAKCGHQIPLRQAFVK